MSGPVADSDLLGGVGLVGGGQLMGELVRFKRPDGLSAPGYLSVPAGGKDAPAVVVLQEWWGLNEQVKGIVDRLAAAGFRALAPDLFRGRLAATPDEETHLMTGLNWGDAANQDLRGAVAYLKEQASAPVAALGFCMGGALTLLGLLKVPEFSAGVCFYGVPPSLAADPGQIKRPLLCHFAKHDDWCTPRVVDELEARLRAGSVPYELHRYDARHGFFNEKRAGQYSAASAELAWKRTLDFLNRALR